MASHGEFGLAAAASSAEHTLEQAGEMRGSSETYDVSIVGAGHNGLVCAFYLAQAGLKVGLFESRDVVGGACTTEELIPGYRFSSCANWVGWWRPKILSDMNLLNRGLDVGGADLSNRVLPNGSGFTWWPEEDRLKAEIARHSAGDAEKWSDWRGFWTDVTDRLGPWLLSYPPTATDRTNGSLDAIFASLSHRSAAELIDDYFDGETMRSGIAMPHDVGSASEPGSAMVMALAEAMEHFSETGEPAPAGYVRSTSARPASQRLPATSGAAWVK